MVLQIGSRLRDMKRDERDISFLLVQILARDHGCLASRIKRSLITPFSFIFPTHPPWSLYRGVLLHTLG